MKPAVATFLAGSFIAIVAAQSLGMFGGGVSPTISSPGSFVLVLPAFLGLSGWLIVLFALGAFWLWTHPLFSGESKVPLRTVVLFFIVSLLSIANFWLGWRYAITYQGPSYTYWCAAINYALLLTGAALLWRARTVPSFYASLATHTLLFAWIYSYAFAYLGETP